MKSSKFAKKLKSIDRGGKEDQDMKTYSEAIGVQTPYMHMGTVAVMGIAPSNFETEGRSQQLYDRSYSSCRYASSNSLILHTLSQHTIEVKIPFNIFFTLIKNKPQLGQLRYFCNVQKTKKQKQQQQNITENLSKKQQKSKSKTKKNYDDFNFSHVKKYGKKSLKKLSKIFFPIRIEIYINRSIFNQKSMTYTTKLKDLDNLQTNITNYKTSTQQYKSIKQMIENLQEELQQEKIIRSLLMYLMELSHVKILNRSFVKPPPKLNYLMRQYRRKTIGLITRNKRNQRRIQNKIRLWKTTFQWYDIPRMCIGPQNYTKFIKQNYYPNIPKQCLLWAQRYSSDYGQQIQWKEKLKFQIMNGIQKSTPKTQKFLFANLKKVMNQIGAYGFLPDEMGDQDDQSDTDDQAQHSKKNMDPGQYKLMKKNQSLMEKFQTENKYFKKHQTPPSMISQLKPYQGQALQWMKYRQGKINVDQLFQQEYADQVKDFEFERKLSPFWEEIETLNGQKFFINYLTGEFTRQFHDWRSIRGGILADQMGLGKTVMTLSLLADEQWQGINLIVVPVAVLLQWKQQITKHCGNGVNVYQFHSDAKTRRKKNLKDYQIILVTYATLGNQYKAFANRKPDSTDRYLFDYNFQRVILDQAHNIRGTNTLQFKAVMELKSNYSWCLTGTLIQNSQQDLFAIFKFLRVEVFSEEPWWNQYIKNAGCTQAKLNVIQTVLRPIVLRRTKASTTNHGQSILQLVGKKQFVIKPEFSKLEDQVYRKLQNGVKKFFKQNVQAGKSYTHIFQIISKLRQFCCHPALIFGEDVEDISQNDIEGVLKKFLQGGKSKGTQFKQDAVNAMLSDDETCKVCLVEPDTQNAVLTQCGHFFCQPCLKKVIANNAICPCCRSPISSTTYIKKGDLGIPEQLQNLTESSKITAILKVLQQINERNEKCVIFTQWIKIIGVLEEKIAERSLQFAVIKGSMTPEKRQREIRKFKEKDTCRFLIVSIKAGATGLNLANANNVMICDPWWNPSHQDQAVGRVHRMGQTQEVNVYRFIMKNSIQEKIQKMHEGKRRLANQVMMQKGSLQQPKGSSAEELIKLLGD